MTFKIRLPGNNLHTRKCVKDEVYSLTLALNRKSKEQDILIVVGGICEESIKIGQTVFRILESSIELWPNEYNSENWEELEPEVNTRLRQGGDYKGLLVDVEIIAIHRLDKDEEGRKALETVCFLMALEDKMKETDFDPVDPKLLKRIEIIKKKGEENKRRMDKGV